MYYLYIVTDDIMYNIVQYKPVTLTGMTGSGCLVNVILPSRNGGTMLWTNKWTRASLSSSKSSSKFVLTTTPLLIILLVSQSSLSCSKYPKLIVLFKISKVIALFKISIFIVLFKISIFIVLFKISKFIVLFKISKVYFLVQDILCWLFCSKYLSDSLTVKLSHYINLYVNSQTIHLCSNNGLLQIHSKLIALTLVIRPWLEAHL